MKEARLFAEALELPPGKRERFLREACGDDDNLRRSVEELLHEHENEGGLLDESLRAFRGTLPASSDHEPPASDMREGPTGERILYFGDYILHEEIARGAMGVVYRAEQTSLKRIVAIKMIRSTLLVNEADIARFRTEAESAASLDHPNIVPIYEIGEHEGQHYFSMKLIEGGTLRDHLERLRSDPKATVKLITTVARAVHAAHQRGILHRDLKPTNILIDEGGEPHMTDFGLAKQMESASSATLSGQIMGTPGYMAPEQAQGGGKTLTTRADIYALGAILYEILTGRPPHKGDSLMETLQLVATAGPEAPRTIDCKIDRDLETIAMKCLQKDPAQRYASAQGLVNDLNRWRRGEPIEARPVGTAEKVFKWIKRKPAQATAAGIGIVLLLTLGIGGPIAALRQAKLKKDAILALARSQIALAEGAYRDGDAQRAIKFLEDCPDDVRDTHWRYLRYFSDESLYQKKPPGGGRIVELARAPGSRGKFYSLDNKGRLSLIEGKTGEELTAVETGRDNNMMTVSPDGSLIALVSKYTKEGGTIGTHSTETLDKIALWPLGDIGNLHNRFFIPNSDTLVVGGYTGSALIDVRTGGLEVVPDFRSKCAGPEGKKLYGARVFGANSRIGSLDLKTRDFTEIGNASFGKNINAMAVSPDNRYLFAATAETIRAYRLAESRLMYTFSGDEDKTYQMEFSKEGASEATSGNQGFELITYGVERGHGVVRFWRVSGGKTLLSRSIFVSESNPAGAACAWDIDAGLLLTGQTHLRGFLMSARFSYPRVALGESGRFLDESVVGFNHLPLGGPGNIARLVRWDLESNDKSETFEGLNGVLRSLDRSRLLGAPVGWATAGSLSLPGLTEKSSGPELVLPPRFPVEDLAVSNDGRLIAGAGMGGVGVLRLADSGETETVFLKRIDSSDFPDNIKAKTTRVFLLPREKGSQLLLTFQVQKGSVHQRVFQLLELDSGEVIRSGEDPVATSCLTLDLAQNAIIAGAADGTIRFKDIHTFEDHFVFRAHDQNVTAVALRPDGDVLASGDIDGMIRLWRMAHGRPARLLREIVGFNGMITSLDFSPSGERLVTGSGYLTVPYGLTENEPLLPQRSLEEPLDPGESLYRGIMQTPPENP